MPKHSKAEIATSFPEFPETGQHSFHQQLRKMLRSLDLKFVDLARSMEVVSRTLTNWNQKAEPEVVEQYIARLARMPNWRASMGDELRGFAALHRASLGDAIQPMPPVAAAVSATPTPPALGVAAAAQRLTAAQAFAQYRHTSLLNEPLAGDDTLGSLDASFVNLRIHPEQTAKPGQPPELCESLDDLLTRHPAASVWVLAGDAGGGKSTLLFKLELQRATAALDAWQQAGGAKTLPELCLRVSLSNCNLEAGEKIKLPDWIDAQMAEMAEPGQDGAPGHAARMTLADLEASAKVRLLFDGLNELRAATAEQRRTAQEAVMHWAARRTRRGQPAPIFAVRRIDYQPLITDQAEGHSPREADVLPWVPGQIEAYCQKRFPGSNNPIWQAVQAMAQDPRKRLLDLMSNPFNLKLQCDLFRDDGGQLAGNRAALIGRMGLLRLHKAQQADKLGRLPPTLLSAADANTLNTARKPGGPALHQLVLEGNLLPTLANLGSALHQRGGAGAWVPFGPNDDVWPVLHPDPKKNVLLLDPLRQAALGAGLLSKDANGQLRFSHQLWQEYFAAWGVARRRSAADGPDFRAGAALPTPASEWALQPPRPSDWDQTVQLAVAMADDPEPLLAHLSEVNLALAARARLARGKVQSADHAACHRRLGVIKQKLLAISISRSQLLEQRIEAGLLLGELGDDIRYRAYVGPEGHRYLLPADPWPAGVPGRAWLSVPAGRQTFKADDRPVDVHLAAGLGLAFAPVTVAEFRCFVDAGGYGPESGDEPPPWWQGEAAHRWWRGELENLGFRQAITWARSAWVAGETRQVREVYLSATKPEDFDREFLPLFEMVDADFEGWLDGEVRPERLRKPLSWGNPRLTNALQPVVGISLFEAQAYCCWLSHQAGCQFRLPTEAEWSVVAQRGVQSEWPWAADDADTILLTERMNFLDTRVRRTTPVAVFPAGATPDGGVDMAGQVWEWCSSAVNSENWNEVSGTEVEADACDATIARAVRGGSWIDSASGCRPALRNGVPPGGRSDLLGFRLLCCPILGF